MFLSCPEFPTRFCTPEPATPYSPFSQKPNNVGPVNSVPLYRRTIETQQIEGTNSCSNAIKIPILFQRVHGKFTLFFLQRRQLYYKNRWFPNHLPLIKTPIPTRFHAPSLSPITTSSDDDPCDKIGPLNTDAAISMNRASRLGLESTIRGDRDL